MSSILTSNEKELSLFSDAIVINKSLPKWRNAEKGLEKTKYAKARNDFIGSREKAISKKFDIAKLMAEIVKHNGDISDTLNDKDAMKNMSKSFNINELRRAIKEQMSSEDKPETYELKR
jgi:hypothetical protein